jgi:hypothetical protein
VVFLFRLAALRFDAFNQRLKIRWIASAIHFGLKSHPISGEAIIVRIESMFPATISSGIVKPLVGLCTGPRWL